MKTSFKRKAGAILACTTLFTGHAHGQMVVVDPANVAQSIKQVAAWQQQYAQMQNQLGRMQTQIESMTGDRGMGRLLPGNRTYLPPNWNSAMTSLSSGNTGASPIQALATQIRNAQSVLNPNQIGRLTPQMQAYLIQTRNLSASQQAMGQHAYQTAAQRVNTLQSLTDQINGQTDPKAVMDLQARIQSESAALANDQAQLQAVSQLTLAQQQAQQNIVNEIRVQTSGQGNFPPLVPDFNP